MKCRYLAAIGAAIIVTVGFTTEVKSNQASTNLAQETVIAAASGVFTAGEHPTQGMVRVINENGRRYLEFDNTFKTDNGPDLHVILYRSDAPPVSGIKQQDYAIVGRLKKVSGMQRYAIPENVKLENFRSVAIWCRKFNATFGYAALGM